MIEQCKIVIQLLKLSLNEQKWVNVHIQKCHNFCIFFASAVIPLYILGTQKLLYDFKVTLLFNLFNSNKKIVIK